MPLPHDYYSNIARQQTASPFLSPIGDPKYRRDVAEWLTAGSSEQIAEVGAGYGELVALVGPRAHRSRFWVIDSCPEFLQIARQRWAGSPRALECVHLDIQQVAPYWQYRLEARFARILAINVLQDVDLLSGLATITSWLKPGGHTLVTILAKETMDSYYTGNDLYDAATGLYYRPTRAEWSLGIRPTANGEVPYERVLRFHSLDDARQAAKTLGLQIVRERSIAYRASMMLARWRAAGTLSTFPDEQLRALERSDRYIDCYEFILGRYGKGSSGAS